MLFNSYIFILLFLPLCLAGYFGLNHLGRYTLAQAFLLGMSLWFYGYFNPSYLAIITVSIVVNYLFTRLMARTQRPALRKLQMITAVLLNLGVLFYYKYFDFFITNVNRLAGTDFTLHRILLPLGISFFTFQQLSYIIDAWRGEVSQYKFLQYASFVAYFPQLIAGPIVTHDELIPQFMDESKKRFNWDNFARGMYIFVLGLAKKVLIADVFGIDSWFLFEDRGAMRTDAEYPMYLYDDNILNDVSYLLNKQVLCENTLGVLKYTRAGGLTTNFDDYSFWGDGEYGQTGREIALQNSPRSPQQEPTVPFTLENRRRLTENLRENTIRLARDNPQIQFIYFFPPYSILYWDHTSRAGKLDRELEAWKLATELLLEVDNIQLYSFYTDFDTVTDLDNYRDNVHYGPEINELLLDRMSRGEGLLTRDNCETHWQQVADFYRSYDYDALYE